MKTINASTYIAHPILRGYIFFCCIIALASIPLSFFTVIPILAAAVLLVVLTYIANQCFYKIYISDQEIRIVQLFSKTAFKHSDLVSFHKEGSGLFQRINIQFSENKKYRLFTPEKIQEFDNQVTMIIHKN